MSSDEWYNLKDKKAKKVSLQPDGMDCRKCFVVQVMSKVLTKIFYLSVSSIQPQVTQTKSFEHTTSSSNIRLGFSSENAKSKQDEVISQLLIKSYFSLICRIYCL